MATGKLTVNEKYIIQGLHRDGKTPEDIAAHLGRTVKTVNAYLENLDDIHTTVAKVQAEKVEEEPVSDEALKLTSPEVINDAIQRLIKLGYTELDSNKMVNKALNAFFSNVGTNNPKKLQEFALRFVKAGELMIKRSNGGESGVTIMTEASSDRADYIRNRGKKTNRKLTNTVFSVKDGKPKYKE